MASKNNSVRFTTAEKRKLAPGEEMTDGEVIWRKLKDGSGSWRYDFRMHGKRHKGTLGREKDGMTLSQARTELQRIRAKVTLEAPRPTAAYGLQKRPFHAAADDFLRWSKAHHQDFRHNLGRMQNYLLPHFGEQPIGAISVGDVEVFRTELLTQGLSNTTVRRVISLLSNVFEYAKQTDQSLVNPARGLRRLRAKPEHVDVFPEADVEKLLNPGINPDVDGRAMVALARYAGLRASEVLALEWACVDLKKHCIHIRQTVVDGELMQTTKSGKARSVPISRSLLPVLQELHKIRSTDKWLFPGKDPARPRYQVQPVFRRMKNRADLSDAPGFHALRHRFATSALENGVTVHNVKNWMGHSSIRMTERYVHLTGSHEENMATRLA